MDTRYPTADPDLSIEITPNERLTPPGKLADAALIFHAGPLAGLRLVGFAIRERKGGSGRNVTFPARQYTINGEWRSFALLRPVVLDAYVGPDLNGQDRVRDLILTAYAQHETAAAAA